MKLFKKLLILIMLLLFMSVPVFSGHDTIEFTENELKWLEDHQDMILNLGLDPFSGMDYFQYQGQQLGYIVDVVELLKTETQLNIQIIDDQTWNDVYNGLQTGSIDILFGANATRERKKIMSFTEPIHKYPYAVFVNTTSDIRTLGDLDKKYIGFVEGDIAIDLFSQAYANIKFEVVTFDGQPQGLTGLEEGVIDGFITSGGGIVYDFMYHYPDIRFVAEIQNITSDMTLATLTEENEILAEIISKVIVSHQKGLIKEYIGKSEISFNKKLLQLTDDEYMWLLEDGQAVVGVVSDYLPFDYYDNDDYKGIAGEVLKEIESIIGMKFKYVYGDFDEIYQKALSGEVEILNIAKTEERLETFLFPQSYSQERDLIYGKKNAAYVQDIYGLENKKVAVIKGFWHEEFLKKNLRDVDIVVTNSIKESLRLLNGNKVDYLIENPTVADYYIGGLGYWNIIKKGETSANSFLYFGVNKQSPIVASLMDKALTLVDYDLAKQKGLDTVPSLMSLSVFYMILIILALTIIIFIVIVILIKNLRSLIKEKEASAVLKEREHLMYSDVLTGLNNRLYYNFIEESLNEQHYPQIVIISDLNNLKAINDSMGHHVGDAYIKAYGHLLKETAEDAIVCRMGGDEFIIIKTGSDSAGAEGLIKTLKSKSKDTPVMVDDQKVDFIDAAYGYAIRYDARTFLEDITKEADNKMYANKKKNRPIKNTVL